MYSLSCVYVSNSISVIAKRRETLYYCLCLECKCRHGGHTAFLRWKLKTRELFDNFSQVDGHRSVPTIECRAIKWGHEDRVFPHRNIIIEERKYNFRSQVLIALELSSSLTKLYRLTIFHGQLKLGMFILMFSTTINRLIQRLAVGVFHDTV